MRDVISLHLPVEISAVEHNAYSEIIVKPAYGNLTGDYLQEIEPIDIYIFESRSGKQLRKKT